MTTQIHIEAWVESLSDTQLLDQYEDSRNAVVSAQRVKGHLEQEIYRRMEERGAKAIPDETFVCEISQASIYDQDSFRPLLEVFNAPDLETCFTPEHTEPVAAKWTTGKVLALARRYGDAALAIVAKAKQPGPRSLKFQRR